MSVKAKNEIRFKIEEDGAITISTDDFSPEIHTEANKVVKEVIELAGGERKVISHKSHDAHVHVHEHKHGHTDSKVKA